MKLSHVKQKKHDLSNVHKQSVAFQTESDILKSTAQGTLMLNKAAKNDLISF